MIIATMKLCCLNLAHALQKILLYCIDKVIHCICWGYIATNFICGYIWVYVVARRVILPLKLVCGHYMWCSWDKSKGFSSPPSERSWCPCYPQQPSTYVRTHLGSMTFAIWSCKISLAALTLTYPLCGGASSRRWKGGGRVPHPTNCDRYKQVSLL